jgi:hypothetical protein
MIAARKDRFDQLNREGERAATTAKQAKQAAEEPYTLYRGLFGGKQTKRRKHKNKYRNSRRRQ